MKYSLFLLSLIGIASIFTSSVHAANSVVAGDFITEPATLNNVGFE